MKHLAQLQTLKLRLAVVILMLFSFGWSQSPNELVECDLGAYYQTVKLKSAISGEGAKNDFILYRINPISGQFTFIANLSVSDGTNDLAVPRSVNINSLGVNPVDRQFYFVNAKAPYQLYKMSASGNVSYLGNITGDISGNNQAGVFNYDGKYYLTGGSKKVFEVNVNTLTSTRLMNVNFVASDLAINPNNGKLYGWDQNRRQLNTIDINSLTSQAIGPAANTSDFGIFGALYFLPSGQLIGYGDNTTIGPQGNSQESLVDINLSTGVVTPISTSLSVSTNDGASCPFTISLDKEGPAVLNLNNTITYTFTVYNRTGRTLNDLVFQDQLTNSLVFTSNAYDITNGISISGTANQQNTANLAIDNVPVGASSFKLNVFVGCDYSATQLNNQAFIGLTNLDDPTPSNDPTTPEVNDPTISQIVPLSLDVPSEIIIEGCSTEDINANTAVFEFSTTPSGNVSNEFDNNPDYNYTPSNIQGIIYVDNVIEDSCPVLVERTFTITDNCDNTISKTQLITVQDTAAPQLEEAIPPVITLDCDAEINLNYTAIDNCDGEVIGQSEDTIVPGECENDYVISRVWVFTDSCGNSSRFEQTIIIKDETSPVFDGELPLDTAVECDAIPTAQELTATDNCGDAEVTFNEVRQDGDCNNTYTLVRTWTATDACGNETTHTQNLTVQDTTPPVLPEIVPIVTVSCDETIDLIYTAQDNCDGEVIGEFADIVTPGECENESVIARTWSFTDSCGNASIFEQTIIVEDTVAPIFDGELPQNTTAECSDIPVAPTLTATDNCGEGQVTLDETSETGSCIGENVITRTWTATDACGNATTHTQTITVQDTTPPVFEGSSDAACQNLLSNGGFEANPFNQGFQQLPQEQVEGWNTTANHGTLEIQRSGRINGVVSYDGNYHFELNGKNLDDLYQTFETEPGSNLTIKFYHRKRPGSSVTDDMRLLIGADLNNLVAISDFAVSTEDGWKENILNYIVPEGQTTTVLFFQALTGSTNSVGNLLDKISVVPDANNGVSCLPEDITVECDAIPAPLDLIASDNCSDVSVSFSEEQLDGDCANNYTLVRTWTATDDCGNTTTLTQNVEVVDTTGPSFVEDLPLDVDAECDAIPDVVTLTAIDNCGDADVTFEEEIVYNDDDSNEDLECTFRAYYVKSGNTSEFYKFVVDNNVANFELVTTRNYNSHLAYDGQNNILYGINNNGQSVERIDPSTGTSLGFIQLQSGLNSVASGTYYNGKLYLGSSNQNRIVEVDPSTGNYVTIADNVPVNGGDLEIRNGQLYLATRAGHKLYLIENGQASEVSSIPTNVSGMANTEDGNFFVSYNNSNSFGIINNLGESQGSVAAFLNGQPFSLQNGDMASGCGTDLPPTVEGCNNYSIVRTWTATDACGNTTEHVQTINVFDTTAPVFDGDLPTDITVECSEIPNPADISATDNCSDVTVIFTEDSIDGDCEGTYTLQRTWIASDACGNTTSHSQTVTVVDTTAPEFEGDLPEELTVECTDVPDASEVTATDNCSEVNINFTEETTEGSCAGEYLLERTWTATDACGNSTSHSQLITVVDTTAPEVVGDFETNIEVACDNIPEAPGLTFEDACSEVMDVTFNEDNTQVPGSGDYQILRTWTVTDTCGNEAVFTQTVNVINESTVGGLDSEVCNIEGPYDLFNYLIGDYEGTGVWTVVQGNPEYLSGSTFTTEFIEEDTQYIFNYTETGGSCDVQTDLAIMVTDCRVLSCGAEDVIISKAVTANGDSYNEFFTVEGIEDCGFVIEVEIYNRWGARVYQSNDYQNDWNGTTSGAAVGGSGTVPTGTYYYVVKLKNSGLDPFAGPLYVATNK